MTNVTFYLLFSVLRSSGEQLFSFMGKVDEDPRTSHGRICNAASDGSVSILKEMIRLFMAIKMNSLMP